MIFLCNFENQVNCLYFERYGFGGKVRGMTTPCKYTFFQTPDSKKTKNRDYICAKIKQ